jgi:hypothetical protein
MYIATRAVKRTVLNHLAKTYSSIHLTVALSSSANRLSYILKKLINNSGAEHKEKS